VSTIDFNLKCARCGGDLKGTPLDGVCSKCNAAIDTTLDLSAIDPDAMTVRQDVSCIGCDYNLRTLAIKSLCPECGRPVADSLHRRLLVFANPRWLAEQRWVSLLTAGALVAPVVIAALAAIGITVGSDWVSFPVGAAIICLSLIALVVFVIGPSMLCTPDPSMSHPKSVRRREALCGSLVVTATLLFAVLIPLSGVAVLAHLVGGGAVCCTLGLYLCAAMSIRYTGPRVPGRWFRRLANAWVMSLITGIVSVVLWVLLVGVPMESSGSPFVPTRIAWPLLCFVGIAIYLLALLTLGVYYLVLSKVCKRQGARV